ncbi:Translation initiation factor 2 subunit beta [uncultured archaeon]|nr:Translation initiation factor 2 subunit beta [uncultured archaeon]
MLKRARAALPEKTLAYERFEPPVPETQIQGSKTILRNFELICTKLRREPALLSKYLSKELAVPATIDGGKLILHGKVYDRMLNEKLSNFISSYVVCKECKRPDTKLVDGAHGIRTLVCEACGARAPAK